MDVDSDYSPAASPLPKATAAPLGNATNKVCGLESGSNAAEGRGSWLGGAAWQMRAAFALARWRPRLEGRTRKMRRFPRNAA